MLKRNDNCEILDPPICLVNRFEMYAGLLTWPKAKMLKLRVCYKLEKKQFNASLIQVGTDSSLHAVRIQSLI